MLHKHDCTSKLSLCHIVCAQKGPTSYTLFCFMNHTTLLEAQQLAQHDTDNSSDEEIEAYKAKGKWITWLKIDDNEDVGLLNLYTDNHEFNQFTQQYRRYGYGRSMPHPLIGNVFDTVYKSAITEIAADLEQQSKQDGIKLRQWLGDVFTFSEIHLPVKDVQSIVISYMSRAVLGDRVNFLNRYGDWKQASIFYVETCCDPRLSHYIVHCENNSGLKNKQVTAEIVPLTSHRIQPILRFRSILSNRLIKKRCKQYELADWSDQQHKLQMKSKYLRNNAALAVHAQANET